MKAPRVFWQLIKLGPRVAYALGMGSVVGKFVLLLTTVGRTSGRPRITPLVYKEQDGTLTVASARGGSADWLQNIRANPNVRVRVGRRRLEAHAQVIIDQEKIADYLQHQLDRNPAMFGAILRLEGLSAAPTRAELLRLAGQRPMVEIRPRNAKA